MGYCSVEDVQIFLPGAIRFEGDNPDPNPADMNPETLLDAEVEGYIEQATQYINSRIGAVYDVPLRKVNIGGTLSYPHPIPSICARLTAKFIWQRRLAGADRETGNFVDKHHTEAMEELNDVLRGYARLQNQDSNRSRRFAASDWFDIPTVPVKDGPPERR